MENLYKQSMDQVKMSQECAKRIRKDYSCCASGHVTGKHPHFRSSFKMNRAAIAVMAFFICLLSITTVAYAATNGQIFDYVYSFFSGGGIRYEEGENGESATIVTMGEDSVAPAVMDNGRLYFVAAGNHVDITDKISEEKPFLFEITDDQGVIHKYIIGGLPKEEHFGYQEILFNEKGDCLGSSGSYGSQIKEVREECGIEDIAWLKNGKKQLGLEEW